MKIYGDSFSGNCLKVKWVADSLGLSYSWIEVDIIAGQSRTPQFLAMNPAGQVPVVVLGDDRCLAQSNAIILHLAEGSPLIPSDAYERAKMLEWMFWEQYSHEPYIAVARFQVHQGRAVADLEPRLVERGKAALQRLEDGLATGAPFLVGSALCLADVALAAYTRVADEGGFSLLDYPRVSAWIGRVEEALKIAA